MKKAKKNPAETIHEALRWTRNKIEDVPAAERDENWCTSMQLLDGLYRIAERRLEFVPPSVGEPVVGDKIWQLPSHGALRALAIERIGTKWLSLAGGYRCPKKADPDGVRREGRAQYYVSPEQYQHHRLPGKINNILTHTVVRSLDREEASFETKLEVVLLLEQLLGKPLLL